MLATSRLSAHFKRWTKLALSNYNARSNDCYANRGYLLQPVESCLFVLIRVHYTPIYLTA